MDYKNKSLCRIRTVTFFITLHKDKTQWESALHSVKHEVDLLLPAIQKSGYVLQSIRIITNPFGEYLDLTDVKSAKADLQYLTNLLNKLNESGIRIRFAIGAATNAQEIALLPELIAGYGDLCNACVNVPLDENGVLDNHLIEQSVNAMQRIAQITLRAEGNFNFTVNFNCKPFIPYFPAGYHLSHLPNSFVIGLETPDLLVEALKSVSKSSHNQFYADCYQSMSRALQYHVDEILATLSAVKLSGNFEFVGIDSSAAPSKNCASITELYELMGVPYFGAVGTVEVSALLTKVFKSVQNVSLVGFSGLMLAVTEDLGLAQGTQQGQFDIRSLLTYSAVCGIGLDTVPVAGNASAESITAIMCDTGTMAFRLNKPLTVRLFPIPNKIAGEISEFESDDLCNCRILGIPY
ncbi:DUF711 family protein [Rodentibacter pneumotropicus]|uniref:DUF711 family protein n=2 Tax=Rodentibacter pneumotropicus TaxID=758 RepID=A0A4S2QIU4_9PAST|nr:DUF711 family protein [Rodentibacter pneumotropicus]THA00687.1 DUF711 family protein [Rodentibacter pneumotropicus]THA01858.1 DUF711 family protein [Rodentibacter pneumotropicus]THA05273.1 DUF711 family protein [Rodentibacter pneumotropicus]THA17160.1 DUF711 family protein [Rodentibacter pneumotropicus]